MKELLERAEEIEADEMKKKKKVTEDEVGSFKELDLKNIDVSGLGGRGTIEKKALNESEKQTGLLQELVNKPNGGIARAV